MVDANDITLRPERPEDTPFLAALFASVRAPDFEAQGWPAEVLHAFLADQYRMQTAHYARFYAGAAFLIVEHDGAAIGRLYVHRDRHEHRIVDISLVPGARNRGIGGALLDRVCAEAAALGCGVSLHVEKHNPAQRLYQRKGFVRTGENDPYWRMARALAPASSPE